MIRKFENKDIKICNGWIHIDKIGQIGLWWKYYDQKVCLSYGVGESFQAKTEEELKEKLLKILNNGKEI